MQETGLIHIYTGKGKGKTTAAVGLAVRALGSGLKVCYAFFHKRPEKYGYSEIKNLELLGADIFPFSKGHPALDRRVSRERMLIEAPEGLEKLKFILKLNNYDMLIMDEVLISVRDHFIEEVQLIEFIKSKPDNLELVMTGRGATARLIELSDYVSEIQVIKHPFIQKGMGSRKGIEY